MTDKGLNMTHVAKWFLVVVGFAAYVGAAEMPVPPAPATGRAAQTFDIAKGSIVSLRFDRAPAYEVYESLYRQAGAALKPDKDDNLWDGLAKKPVTINLENVSFWEAMDQLEEQTDLAVGVFPGNAELEEVRGGMPHGPVARYGAFKIVADAMAGPGRYTQLKIFVEPRLRVLSHAREATVTEASDVLGEAVALQRMMPAGVGFDMDEHSGNVFDVQLPMDPESRRIAHLKGTVRVILMTGTARVEIGGLAKANNIEHKALGRRFVVSVLQPAPDAYAISVAAFNTNPPSPGLAKMGAELLDAQGNAYVGQGMSAGGDGQRRMNYAFQFQNPGGRGTADKLVLQLPGQTREIAVPFEFGKPRKQPPQ